MLNEERDKKEKKPSAGVGIGIKKRVSKATLPTVLQRLLTRHLRLRQGEPVIRPATAASATTAFRRRLSRCGAAVTAAFPLRRTQRDAAETGRFRRWTRSASTKPGTRQISMPKSERTMLDHTTCRSESFLPAAPAQTLNSQAATALALSAADDIRARAGFPRTLEAEHNLRTGLGRRSDSSRILRAKYSSAQ